MSFRLCGRCVNHMNRAMKKSFTLNYLQSMRSGNIRLRTHWKVLPKWHQWLWQWLYGTCMTFLPWNADTLRGNQTDRRTIWRIDNHKWTQVFMIPPSTKYAIVNVEVILKMMSLEGVSDMRCAYCWGSSKGTAHSRRPFKSYVFVLYIFRIVSPDVGYMSD